MNNKKLFALALTLALATVAGKVLAADINENGQGDLNNPVNVEANENDLFSNNTDESDDDLVDIKDNDVDVNSNNEDNDEANGNKLFSDNKDESDDDLVDIKDNELFSHNQDNDQANNNQDNDQDNDQVNGNKLFSDNEDNDDLFSHNDTEIKTEIETTFQLGNFADHGGQVFDGDIVGLGGLPGEAGLGGSTNFNTGIVTDSILGDNNVQADNVGVVVNGSSGGLIPELGGSSPTINNNQNGITTGDTTVITGTYTNNAP